MHLPQSVCAGGRGGMGGQRALQRRQAVDEVRAPRRRGQVQPTLVPPAHMAPPLGTAGCHQMKWEYGRHILLSETSIL